MGPTAQGHTWANQPPRVLRFHDARRPATDCHFNLANLRADGEGSVSHFDLDQYTTSAREVAPTFGGCPLVNVNIASAPFTHLPLRCELSVTHRYHPYGVWANGRVKRVMPSLRHRVSVAETAIVTPGEVERVGTM